MNRQRRSEEDREREGVRARESRRGSTKQSRELERVSRLEKGNEIIPNAYALKQSERRL